MAQANVPGTVRARVFTVPEGGGEPPPPPDDGEVQGPPAPPEGEVQGPPAPPADEVQGPPAPPADQQQGPPADQPPQGTVPAGPSGTPIVTVGGGIPGTVTPPVVPVSPVVPIVPAPPPPQVQGPPAPPPTAPVVEPPPPSPGEPGFIGPLDWWLSMDITSRAQLESLIQEMSDTIRNLNNQLSTANDRIAQLESAPPNKGEKGDKGDPGVDGVDGVDGRNGRDGRDGRDATPFVLTGEYQDLVQSSSSANQKATAAQQRADNAMSIALTARSENAQTRSMITGISANPNLVSVPPSASQVADAVENYLRSHPPSQGPQGLPGTPATPEQIASAVNTWLSLNRPQVGASNEQVQSAVNDWLAKHPVTGVTPSSIASAVATYLQAHPPSGGGGGGTTTVVQNPYVLTYTDVYSVLNASSGSFLAWLFEKFTDTDVYTFTEQELTPR